MYVLTHDGNELMHYHKKKSKKLKDVNICNYDLIQFFLFSEKILPLIR